MGIRKIRYDLVNIYYEVFRKVKVLEIIKLLFFLFLKRMVLVFLNLGGCFSLVE